MRDPLVSAQQKSLTTLDLVYQYNYSLQPFRVVDLHKRLSNTAKF
jgi:hypothetical protein